jgi:hypothetical protein
MVHCWHEKGMYGRKGTGNVGSNPTLSSSFGREG